jgi:hypothetical protein
MVWNALLQDEGDGARPGVAEAKYALELGELCNSH